MHIRISLKTSSVASRFAKSNQRSILCFTKISFVILKIVLLVFEKSYHCRCFLVRVPTFNFSHSCGGPFQKFRLTWYSQSPTSSVGCASFCQQTQSLFWCFQGPLSAGTLKVMPGRWGSLCQWGLGPVDYCSSLLAFRPVPMARSSHYPSPQPWHTKAWAFTLPISVSSLLTLGLCPRSTTPSPFHETLLQVGPRLRHTDPHCLKTQQYRKAWEESKVYFWNILPLIFLRINVHL